MPVFAMAVNFIRRSLVQTHKSFTLGSPFSMNKNALATFAPYYVNPVFKKDKLNALMETEDPSTLSTTSVKPPLPYETSSELYDEIVGKFTNYIMRDGKKSRARRLLEETFEIIKRSQIERYHLSETQEEKDAIVLNPKEILHKAILNTQPLLQLTPIKRGGATYQVPIPVTESRARFMAQRWILEAARDREFNKLNMAKQLAWELMDAANNRGKVLKRKQDLHKQCEANRAYAHYRWG